MSAKGSILFVLFALLSRSYGDSSPNEYELPANSTVVLGGQPVTGFSCDGLRYGYYADVANDCKVYHVCSPYTDPQGFTFIRHFSFICGAGTVFNQAALVCDYPYNSIPCENSPDLYSINDYFGQDDVNFRE